MNTHSCIKCGTEYQDEDTEAYYCAPCLEAHRALAKEVDAKLAHIPQGKTMSSLQEYDNSMNKVGGFLRVSL